MNLPDKTYFRSLLVPYLKTHHPQLADDESFIEERTDEAADLYTKAVAQGAQAETAYDLATKVLFYEL